MRLFGLKTTVSTLGIISFLLAALGLAGLSAAVRGLSLGPALLAGALSAAAMIAGEWLHQAGHAWAARRAGWPMTGIHFHTILAASHYSPDEPPLPAAVHARRALGGFWVNLLLGALLTPLALALWPRAAVAGWVAGFAVVYNVVVLGLGALLPLRLGGFETDGGTLLRLWLNRRSQSS